MTEDEMAGWHHRLDGHESEQDRGIGDGEGSLACCSPWGHKELDMPEQLNLDSIVVFTILFLSFQEHIISFHLFMLSLITLISALRSSACRSFVSLGKFIP